MNGYMGCDAFSFCILLCQRIWMGATGEGGVLAADEMQILVLFFTGISGTLLGTFLQLQKMTMLANSLSHTVLLGIVAVAYMYGLGSFSGFGGGGLLLAACLAGVLTSLATEFLVHVVRLQKDASIGLVFSAFFALGILLITLFFRRSHIGVEAIFGNIDAVTMTDVWLTGYAASASLIFVYLLYHRLVVVSFDASFGTGIGLSPSLFRITLLILTSAAAIASFRAVGVFLVLSLLVTPPLIARLMTHSLQKMLMYGMLFNTVCAVVSVALSRHALSVWLLPLSTSGIFVTLSGVVYIGALALKNWRLLSRTKRGILPTHE